MKSSWQPIIGLEVHVELKTKSKMFCRCTNKHFQTKSNKNVCPVCLGLPGALPVPNKKAVEQTIGICQTFHCKISNKFSFDRKNYFYPDLPKGYQISQHFSPIGREGNVPILVDGKTKLIKLNDIHLEEDTAKLIHTKNQTLVNFNRSGVPLVEIVSAPVIESASEAKAYVKRLQQTIRWLEFSDCDMEKGSMRLEANISLKPINQEGLPDYRVEVKNLNSFRFLEKAIDYEISRQKSLLEEGKTIKQETRGFDLEKGITFSQRSKEVAKDYRYFPEPDIPPFYLEQKQLDRIKASLPKLPWETEEEIIKNGVRWKWAKIICQEKNKATLYKEALNKSSGKIKAEEIANWLVNKKVSSKTTSEKLLKLIEQEKNRFNLSSNKIEQAAQNVIASNPQPVADYTSGKKQAIGFLIGLLMRETEGKANPNEAKKVLEKLLK